MKIENIIKELFTSKEMSEYLIKNIKKVAIHMNNNQGLDDFLDIDYKNISRFLFSFN